MQDHLQKSWSDPKGPRRRRIYTTLQQGVQASPSATPGKQGFRGSNEIQVLGESKKNFFKILYFSSVEVDPFVFEHFYFFLYSGSRCLSLKSPNPTGCGNNPVSGNLGRIGVSSHGLPDPPICSGFQGMGNFFIGRYAPFRHLP